MDFYKQVRDLFFLSLCSQLSQTSQKRFICEITGHSGLSFFDALKSEVVGFHGSPYILILKKNREP
jgi:energy-converting hydrogenase Eha subunit H